MKRTYYQIAHVRKSDPESIEYYFTAQSWSQYNKLWSERNAQWEKDYEAGKKTELPSIYGLKQVRSHLAELIANGKNPLCLRIIKTIETFVE